MKKLEWLAQRLEEMIHDANEVVANGIQERDDYAATHGSGYHMSNVYKDLTKNIYRDKGREDGLEDVLDLVKRLQYCEDPEIDLRDLEEDY